MPRKKTKTKKKSTVNKAGNYTKPTMRKRLLKKLKQEVKVVDPDNGVLEKHRCWQENIRLKVEDTNKKLLRRPLWYMVFLPTLPPVLGAIFILLIIYNLQS